MKSLKIIITTLAAFLLITVSFAQTGKDSSGKKLQTQSIKVNGECDMCKHRIEAAALKVEGVQSAEWNTETKILSVKYDTQLTTTPENVQKKMAEIGHDTEKYTATDTAYNNLPGCCHYQRKTKP